MTNAEALKKLEALAASGQIILGSHARDRMAERGVRYQDIRNALENATSCAPSEADRWAVKGPDVEGDELTVVVVITGSLIVVTVF